MPDKEIIIVSAEEMLSTFESILLQKGFGKSDANQLATVFQQSSIDGVYTHGVNRFSRFVEYIEKGYVIAQNKPSLTSKSGNIEQWDGQLGPGPLNALFATDQAIRIARESGIGCVALSNTNHWMRGGTYGWHAAQKGFIFIGFTNTIANMPTWGGLDRKLGNNPFVIAIPYKDEAIVLDMAMSQYSIGALNQAAMKNEMLPVEGGFDSDGNLTKDPHEILESNRPLATGYWKGAGMALLLDILAVVLSGGLSTAAISRKEAEYAVSQVFIVFDLTRLHNFPSIQSTIDQILEDYLKSLPATKETIIHYPGERVLMNRKQNLESGIPVIKEVWNQILAL